MRCASPGSSAGSAAARANGRCDYPAPRHRAQSIRATRHRAHRNAPMLRIEYVYWLCGALFLAAGGFDLGARRYASAAFWAILAACFLAGDAVEAAAAAGNMLP